MVVEGAQVEARPELFFGVAPQLLDLELAHLVAGHGPRLDDVAVDLVLDLVLGPGRILPAVPDRLLAGPPHGMEAGVDHQADRPPDLGREPAEAGVGVAIEAELAPQALGVEPPALGERGVDVPLAPLGFSLDLLGERELEVVP